MPFTPLPTLREIAKRCGVARSSVGHILGGRSHLFRPETRDLVLATAEAMGWKRPADWRAVRRARFGCVILLKSLNPERSYIGPNLLSALEDRLLDRNMHLTLARLPDETLASEAGLRRLLKQWSADGVLVSYTQKPPPRLSALIAELELPAVWINSRTKIDTFRPDDIGGGRLAAETLLAAGHRRIAYVGYPTPPHLTVEDLHYSMLDRPAGARSAALAAGATWVEVTGVDCQSIHRWRERLGRRERETAVIAYSPLQVMPVLHAALALGLRVPEDLSLITFHDHAVWMLDHEIASLALPEAEVAERAVQHLCSRIAGEPSRAIDPEPFTLRSTLSIAAPPPSARRRRAAPR